MLRCAVRKPRTSTLYEGHTGASLEQRKMWICSCLSEYVNMNDSLSVETVAQSVRSNAVTRGQDIRVLSQN